MSNNPIGEHSVEKVFRQTPPRYYHTATCLPYILATGLILLYIVLSSKLLASTDERADERPRMLIIGDSISMNYTPLLRERLSSQIEVQHIGTNGAHTRNGLDNLEDWLGEDSWDFIHFNWGLHDLRRRGGKNVVPIDEYEKNLRQLVRRLKQTEAHLIWATTTPVPHGSSRRTNERAIAYNEVAEIVMKAKQIDINDLYAFVLPRKEEWMRGGNVHFHEAGYEALANKIESVLRPLLEPIEGDKPGNQNPEIHLVFPDDDDVLGPEVTVHMRVRNFSMSPAGKGFRLYLNDRNFGLFHETAPIPLSDLDPDRYQVRVVLVDQEGEETDISDERYFTVTSETLTDN